VKLGGPNLLV